MMNPESLRALLIDRQLGELPPDVAELLDAYVEAVPAARAEADAVAGTVTTTRETISRFPDLAPKVEGQTEIQIIPIFFWLSRMAALVAVAALAGWLGYRAGQSNAPVNEPAVVAHAADHRFDGLWAQYQVAYDSRRGTVVVSQEQ
jgi:anti-sigma-K factor RskA